MGYGGPRQDQRRDAAGATLALLRLNFDGCMHLYVASAKTNQLNYCELLPDLRTPDMNKACNTKSLWSRQKLANAVA